MLAVLDGTVRRRPWIVTAALLAVAATVAYGPYLPGSGFFLDDWLLATNFAPHRGLLDAVDFGVSHAGGHPVVGVHTGLMQAAFDLHPWMHVTWAIVLAIVTSLLLFGVLRDVGVPVALATVVAVLALVSPVSDAARLWAAGAGVQLSAALFLGGLAVALRAARRPGWRGAALHLGATALYVASLLTYDTAIPFLGATVLVYLLVAPWRRAVAHWLIDLATLVAALAVVHATTPKAIDTSGGAVTGRLQTIVTETLQLLATNGASLGAPGHSAPLSWLVVAVVLGVAAIIVMRGSWGARVSPPLRSAVGLALGGLVVVALGVSVQLVVAGYSPMGFGLANRVMVLTATGVAMTAVGVIAIVALLLAPRARYATLVAAIAGLVVIGGLYVLRLRSHEHAYLDAARQQRSAVDVLTRLGPPPPGDVLYVGGTRRDVAPNIPVFMVPFDLSGALQVAWGRPVDAVPIGALDGLRCGSDGVEPDGPFYDPGRSRTRYGAAIFADARTGRVERPADARACRVLLDPMGLRPA